jgi:uncharacterized protein YdaU (DUF1376 family)
MSKPADTWMPLYIGDYIRDTSRLTCGQHGAYLLLIMDYWIKGPPPDDDEVLATITKASKKEWQKLRKILCEFFIISEGVWRHKRIDAELARADALVEQRRAAGQASGRARAQRKSNGHANETPTSVATKPPTKPPTKAQRKGRPSPSPSTYSSSLRSEEYSEELRSSGAARAPPLPYDGVKSLWDKGLSILGPKQRSLLGKLRKSHGDPAVLAAIVDCEAENPSDPPAFLIACCQRRHDNDRKLSPVENLYLGAARAADAFDRRQREAARCPDCDAVEPLLDRRRSAC